MYLCCGPSGSSKTTLANKVYTEEIAVGNTCVICSTDSVWQESSPEQKYLFSLNGLSIAHKLNQIKCEVAMQQKIDCIIIDNTNLDYQSFSPYIELAIKNEYEISFLVPNTTWLTNKEILFQKNVHNVPMKTIERQIEKFNKLDFADLNNKIEVMRETYRLSGIFQSVFKEDN